MQQTIQNCRGDDLVAEDLAPARQALIGGDQNRPPLVTARYQLEEQVRAEPLQRQIADFIDDQKLRLHELLELLLDSVLLVSPDQRRDQAGRRGESRPVAQSTGLQAQTHCQVRFTHTGRSEQQHVVGIGDEAAGGQLAHYLRVNRGLKLEIEAFQALVERKARHGRLHRRVALLFGRQLSAEQLLQQVGVGELFLARLLQQLRQLRGCTHQFELLHLVLDSIHLDIAPAHGCTGSSIAS